jgi:molybdopterin/thiamine biosynthesis adenylyltransferase
MDLIKHLDIYNPKEHTEPIAVIGAGATGSPTVLQLAKLGQSRVNIYDFDKIERHNIPNQILYNEREHIGKLKCDILAKEVNRLTNDDCCMPINTMVKNKKLKEHTVFLCVDTMRARKEIFENCIFLNGNTFCLIDMRINARSLQINIIDPTDIAHCRYYKETLYSDDEVDPDRGACGVTLSIGATASLAANFSIWLFMDWVMRRNRNIFQITYSVEDWIFFTRKFSDMQEEASKPLTPVPLFPPLAHASLAPGVDLEALQKSLVRKEKKERLEKIRAS